MDKKGIYYIMCTVNGKYYIGQSKNIFSRWNVHKWQLKNHLGIQKLQVDWDLYGESCFIFKPIITNDTFSKEDLNRLEKQYIKEYDCVNSGYNTSAGGIGQGNFGRLNGMYNKHHSEESKRLMSNHRKGLTAGSNNPMYHKHHTQATKDKISKLAKGRKVSKDTKERIKATCLKRCADPVYRQQMQKKAEARRLYTDEFIIHLRKDYLNCGSVKQVALNHSLVYEVCRQAIKGYGYFGRVTEYLDIINH